MNSIFASPVKLAAGNYWIGVITGATARRGRGLPLRQRRRLARLQRELLRRGTTNPFGTPTTDSEQTSLYATYIPTAPIPPPVDISVPTITGTAPAGPDADSASRIME